MPKKLILVGIFVIVLLIASGLYIFYRIESYKAVANSAKSLASSLQSTVQTQAPSIKYLSTTYPYDKGSQSGVQVLDGENNKVVVWGKLIQIDPKNVKISVYNSEVTADLYGGTTFTQTKQSVHDFSAFSKINSSDFTTGDRVAVTVSGNDNALVALDVQRIIP